MCENVEEVFWIGGELHVDDILCWEESGGQWNVDVVDWIGAVEVICVFVVRECVGVLDWLSWSDIEEEGNVDGDDWELGCDRQHGGVGEIWSEKPGVVENVSVEVERWTWELEVLELEEELKTVGWHHRWYW